MVRIALEALADAHALDGCALVDVEAGMVWHAAGPADELTGLAEAVTDFWRLHVRHQGIFAPLGGLQAFVLMHEHKRVMLVGCGTGLVLMALSHRDAAIDWNRWRRDTDNLKQLADSF